MQTRAGIKAKDERRCWRTQHDQHSAPHRKHSYLWCWWMAKRIVMYRKLHYPPIVSSSIVPVGPSVGGGKLVFDMSFVGFGILVSEADTNVDDAWLVLTRLLVSVRSVGGFEVNVPGLVGGGISVKEPTNVLVAVFVNVLVAALVRVLVSVFVAVLVSVLESVSFFWMSIC